MACQGWAKGLRTTTEQQGNDVELQQRAPQPVMSIRAIVGIDQLGEAMDDRLRALSAYLRQHGVEPAGAPFVRYHTFGETDTDLETGIPVAEPVAGEGRITRGELPGGPAISTWHLGPHDTLGDAYARISAWPTAHGHEPDGPSWEVYYWIDPSQYGGTDTWPDPANWRTELVQPVKDTQPR
jgi:effector-binding domain-containing protein